MSETSWIGPLVGSVSGIVGVAVGAVLNYTLSRNRFFRERDWEKKREVYGEIIASLKKAERPTEFIVRNFSDSNKEEFVSSERFLAWTEEMLKSYLAATDCFTKNFLFVSPEITRRFNEFEVEFHTTNSNSNSLPAEHWAELLVILQSAISDLHYQALREVKLH